MTHVYIYLIASAFAFSSDLITKRNKIFIFLSFFIGFALLFYPLAFRGEQVGIDTHAYYKIYYLLLDNSGAYTDYRYEPGFIFLNKLASAFSASPELFIFLSALISFFTACFFIYKYSSSFIMSIALMCGIGVYGFMFNGVRQAIAMGITLIALHFLIVKKVKVYFLVLLIAFFFHYSSIFFIASYFLIRFKYGWFFSIILWLLSLAFLVPSLASFLFTVITPFFPDTYSEYANFEIEASSLRLRIITNQLFCIFYIVVIWVSRKIELDEKTSALLYISMFGFLLGNIFFHLGYLGRLVLYFQIVAMVSVPTLISKVFNRYSYYFLGIVIYMVLTAIYFRGLSLGSNGMVPYSNIWG